MVHTSGLVSGMQNGQWYQLTTARLTFPSLVFRSLMLR